MVMHHMSELALCFGHNAQGDNLITVETFLSQIPAAELYSKTIDLLLEQSVKKGQMTANLRKKFATIINHS